ncbi:MAG: hypothetical protein MJ014_08755, partial [Methanocorpusculum sp.]|nr:hypothetical protein [Methanocorpusculum sp.]
MGKNYEGAAGSYEFDDEGCGRILMQIAQFQSGEVVPVDTYVRPPSEVIIGVYRNAEVVRGAVAGAELINSANALSLPGASTSGISGLYGAKIRILPLQSDSPVPDNVTTVVGDLTGVVTNLSAVPDADAGFSSFLDIVDGRRGYGPVLDNVTVLYPEGTVPPLSMLSALEGHGYRVSQVSYTLPLTEDTAAAVMSGLNCSGQVLVSLPAGAEDLTFLLAGSRQTSSVPAVWYVAGDVIVGDPVLVQSTLVYDFLTGTDI